jgi:hypothetical protein
VPLGYAGVEADLTFPKVQSHSLVAIQRLFMPAFCMAAIQKAVECPPGNGSGLLKT